MLKLRSLITAAAWRSRSMMKVSTPMVTSIRKTHDESTQPFDNMPFRVTNRFILTLVFAFLYGVGLWAPFLIVWYQMAKRTL